MVIKLSSRSDISELYPAGQIHLAAFHSRFEGRESGFAFKSIFQDFYQGTYGTNQAEDRKRMIDFRRLENYQFVYFRNFALESEPFDLQNVDDDWITSLGTAEQEADTFSVISSKSSPEKELLVVNLFYNDGRRIEYSLNYGFEYSVTHIFNQEG